MCNRESSVLGTQQPQQHVSHTMFRLTVFVLFRVISSQSPSDYPTRVPGSCGNITQFDCGNGLCIPFVLVRNCFNDCPNGADEECGANQVLCDKNLGTGCGKCVATADSTAVCLDKRYVRICEQGISGTNIAIYKCATTPNCVPIDWIDDGTNDCGDYSDEDPCVGGYNCVQQSIATTTQLSFCTCKSLLQGNGTIWKPNDPLFKQGVPGTCGNNPLQFDCQDNVNNPTCIDINKVRNCVEDCPNGRDELCWSGTTKCQDDCTCVAPSMAASCPASTATVTLAPSTLTSTVSTAAATSSTTVTTTSSSTSTIPNTTTTTSPTTTTTPTSTTTTTTTTTIPTSTTSTPPTISTTLTMISNTTTVSTTATNVTILASTTVAANTTTTVVPPNANATSTITQTTTSTSASTNSATNATVVATTTKSPTTKNPNIVLCTNQFTCNSGECLSDFFVLDGKNDCADGSDENCFLTCPANQTCRYSPFSHNFTCSCPNSTISTADKICLPVTSTQPRDCADLAVLAEKNNVNFTSGIYTVYKMNCTTNDRSCMLPIVCDMSLDLGGYTVVQRHRGNYSFFRNWNDYKNGFNIGQNDFWQGNEFLSSVTDRAGAVGLYEALVLLTMADGSVVKSKYDRIIVGKESDSYRLTLGNHIAGTDVDNLLTSRNRPFGTYDHDKPTASGIICSSYWQSGWWFDTVCGDNGNLNAPTQTAAPYPYMKGIQWLGPLKQPRNVTESQLLIRPTWYIIQRQQSLISSVITPKTGQNGASSRFPFGFLLILAVYLGFTFV